jgi:SAM-dependent methyltransferase
MDLLCQYARVERPALVVDLGCGTGLSTVAWAERADRVIGLEPSPAMRAVALRRALPAHVEVRAGLGHATQVADASADVVTAVQSFHYMDPSPTLTEVARILRPGGVFAAIDCDGPHSVDWEVEVANHRFVQNAWRRQRELGLAGRGITWPRRWPKAGHLDSITQSGRFAFAKEALAHGVEYGSGARYVESTINWVVEFLDELHERGVTDEQLGLTAFRETAERLIGPHRRWFTSWRIRLGVKGL